MGKLKLKTVRKLKLKLVVRRLMLMMGEQSRGLFLLGKPLI